MEPNAGHTGLAELEKDFNVTVVTQNVDNLHERAGSTHIIHLHGELTKVCSTRDPYNPRYVRELKPEEYEVKMGDKAGDGSQLRPFIVWFGEAVPEIETAVNYVEKADIFVIIGTSLNVYPAAGLLNYVPRTAEVYLIDPKPVDTHSMRQIHIIQKGASKGEGTEERDSSLTATTIANYKRYFCRVVPSHWHAFAIELAQLCHRHGKTLPNLWQKHAKPMARNRLLLGGKYGLCLQSFTSSIPPAPRTTHGVPQYLSVRSAVP